MPCIEYLRLKFATYYIICIAEMHLADTLF